MGLQLKEVTDAIAKHADAEGVALAEAVVDASKPIVDWIIWFRQCRPNSNATELLSGAQASVLETVSYVSLGLGRAALTAIRTQVDQMLSFSYFREHPAEWRLVCSIGDGFKLRSEILRYHKEMDPGKGGFADRLGMLDQSLKPTLEECYRVLSAHVHSQSPNTVSKIGKMRDLVSSQSTLLGILKLQKETASALSGYLLAVHAREWSDLPNQLVEWGRRTLKVDQCEPFFVGK